MTTEPDGKKKPVDTSQPPLNDPKWLDWYKQLQNDRVRRKLGLNRPDEGVMNSVDNLELMRDRGLGPQEPASIDTVRERMGLPPLTDPEARKRLGLPPKEEKKEK
jgi:hypothetical protein